MMIARGYGRVVGSAGLALGLLMGWGVEAWAWEEPGRLTLAGGTLTLAQATGPGMQVQQLPEDADQQPPPEQRRQQQQRPPQQSPAGPTDPSEDSWTPPSRDPGTPPSEPVTPREPAPRTEPERRTETGRILGFHEGREGVYLELALGTSSNRHSELDDAWALHLAVGQYFGMFRGEFELGFRFHEADYGAFTDDFTVFSLLVNVMVDLEIPAVPGLELTAGGGIGGSVADENASNESVSGIAFQFKAGVQYRFVDSFQMGVGYRLLNIDGGDGGDDVVFDSRENFHGFDISLRFNF